MLDEAPTCYIPNLEILPNTARSNKVATIVMCQDLSQLTDGYGKEKADVLFSACNNHFYGRVASSQTSETLSKQFGKTDKTFISQSVGRKQNKLMGKNYTQSESVQERDVIKPAEFLNFNVGEFAGLVVENSNGIFRNQFKPADRPTFNGLPNVTHQDDVYSYYKQVREDINAILAPSNETIKQESNPLINDTLTNDKNNLFDVFGD